jgi:hypothetical protein
VERLARGGDIGQAGPLVERLIAAAEALMAAL